MAYSSQRAVSTGALVLLALSLEYLDRSEITVLYDGVLNSTDWSWVGSTDKTISFSPAVPAGVEVTVKRITDVSELRNSFVGGAAFNYDTLDDSFLQVLHTAQESQEGGNPLTDSYTDINMHGNTVHNLRDAVLSTDAIPLGQATELLQAADSGAVLNTLASASGTTLVKGSWFGGVLAYVSALGTQVGASLIGFIQSGIGAIARSIQDKLRDTVSVKDFGAKGDGITDDAPAIDAAIAAMGYGGEIFFPEGVYKCNSSITVPPVSAGQSGIIFRGIGPGSSIQPGAAMTSLFNVTGKDVVFTKLGIANASSYATNGILFTFLSSDAAFSADVSDCSIGGFAVGISATGQNYDIQNNFFQNNSTHIAFTNDGRNTSIQDNYFLGGSTGIRLSKTVGGTQAEGVRIVNNTLLCTVAGGAQIQINAGFEIFIGHNIIDQTGAGNIGIYIPVTGSDAANRIKVIGNWIAGGLNSYCIFASGNNSDIDLIDNTFAATNGQAVIAGLSLSGTQRAKIALNNFLLSGGVDISTSGTSALKFLENTATGGGSLQNVMGPTQFTGIIDTGATGQVFFPPVQNPSAGPNCLDDYEEGAWVPVVSSGSGALSAVVANGYYTKIGRLVSFYATLNITNNGTGASSINMTLPINAAISGQGCGRENGLTGGAVQVNIGGGGATILTVSNGYPGGTGAFLLVSGSYFSA